MAFLFIPDEFLPFLTTILSLPGNENGRNLPVNSRIMAGNGRNLPENNRGILENGKNLPVNDRSVSVNHERELLQIGYAGRTIRNYSRRARSPDRNTGITG